MSYRPVSGRLTTLALAFGFVQLAGLVMVPHVATSQAHAQEVLLRAKGEGFDFSGQLKSFDGTTYVLETTMGVLTLDASQFECTGTGCTGVIQAAPSTAPAKPENIAIRGSSAIGAALMPALLRGYAQQLGGRLESGVDKSASGERPNEARYRLTGSTGSELAAIDLHRYGSSSGFADLATGAASIGMASRPITPEEVARLTAMSSTRQPPQVLALGLDAIAVIVAPGREVSTLSMDVVAKIFAGQITDWATLGQPAGRITVYAPDSGQGTFTIFNQSILAPAKVTISPYATRIDANEAMSDAVARDANGIGIVSFAYLRKAKEVGIQATCGLLSQPSSFTVKTDEYPLARRLQLYTMGGTIPPVTQGLFAFAFSKEGQAIVAESQFIDLAIESLPYAAQSQRFASLANPAPADAVMARQLTADIGTARRLSITFRFLSGSSVFDPKARQDAVRLVEVLRTPEYKGKTVFFLGFSDTVGSAPANVLLSLKRAGQVRVAVLAAAAGQLNAVQLAAKGYGALAPVACNDTTESQQVNRRVEVWVRD